MKLRNYFFGALACLALASCSSDDDAIDSGQEGKDGVACIAVKLVMPGGNITRAEDSKWNGDGDNDTYYQAGTGAETVVKNAYFYLFDGITQIKEVKVEAPTTTSPGTDNTIERFFNNNHIVIVDEKAPTHIIAVLNVSEDLHAVLDGKSLSDFKEVLQSKLLATCDNTNGLVMSNSVYVNGTTVIQETPVAGKIGYGETADDARADAITKPVTIAVERVFARVSLSTESATINQTTLKDVATTVVRPIVQGWWLDNTNKQSYLIKQLDNSYTFNLVSTSSTPLTEGWWNDASDFRSYWANSYVPGDGKYGHYTWSSANTVDKYCFENTDPNNNTQLVVAAILQTTDNKPVHLIQWGGQDFASTVQETAMNAFFTEVLKNLGNIKKSTDGGTTKLALTTSDLKLIWNNNETTYKYNSEELKNWQSLVTIKKVASTKYYNGDTELSDDQAIINAIYSNIGIVNYYNGGQTYYFTKIEHEPLYKETDYAIIRNHIYKIALNSITGLGTPVPNPADPDDDLTPETPGDDPTPDPTDPYYPDPDNPDGPDYPDDPTDPTDPDQPIIPEKPTDNHSAISATVQILKYRVVSQSVDLK